MLHLCASRCLLVCLQIAEMEAVVRQSQSYAQTLQNYNTSLQADVQVRGQRLKRDPSSTESAQSKYPTQPARARWHGCRWGTQQLRQSGSTLGLRSNQPIARLQTGNVAAASCHRVVGTCLRPVVFVPFTHSKRRRAAMSCTRRRISCRGRWQSWVAWSRASSGCWSWRRCAGEGRTACSFSLPAAFTL